MATNTFSLPLTLSLFAAPLYKLHTYAYQGGSVWANEVPDPLIPKKDINNIIRKEKVITYFVVPNFKRLDRNNCYFFFF